MIRLAIPLLLSLASLAEVRMIEVEGEGRKYWPRWRGPSGQGLVEGKGYVDTWSDTQNVLWKVAVLGRANSSPIVWGDADRRHAATSSIIIARCSPAALWSKWPVRTLTPTADWVSRRPRFEIRSEPTSGW